MDDLKSANPLVGKFISSLRECEKKRMADDQLLNLFNDQAEMINQTRQNSKTASMLGTRSESPRAFWSHYFHAFIEVESTFTRLVDDGRCSVLEWQSHATLPSGTPIQYNGVSILEYNDQGLITGFRTYYDSAALLPHAHRTEKTYSESVGIPEFTTQITS